MPMRFKQKMAQMKKKLGFTLIEMLVVIAIIAVLVSVITPVINISVEKASASTNAANLRSIEGKISVLRIEHPQIFSDTISKEGQSEKEFQAYLDEQNFDTWTKQYLWLMLQDPREEDNAAEAFYKYNIYHQTASNNVITISVAPAVEVTDVPDSKEVEIGDLKIPAGIPMTVYITENTVVATYEYGGNSYTKEDFATASDTGKFTGGGTGGSTGGNLGNDLNCMGGKHVPVDDDCVCKYCGKEGVHHPNENGVCTVCGETSIGHTCDICGRTYYSDSEIPNDNLCLNFDDGNHDCKYDNCNNVREVDTDYCLSHKYEVTCSICETTYRTMSNLSALEQPKHCPNVDDGEHICNVNGCENILSNNKKYCETHQGLLLCDEGSHDWQDNGDNHICGRDGCNTTGSHDYMNSTLDTVLEECQKCGHENPNYLDEACANGEHAWVDNDASTHKCSRDNCTATQAHDYYNDTLNQVLETCQRCTRTNPNYGAELCASGSHDWVNNGTNHKCSRCNKTSNHQFVGETCAQCNYTCTHSWTTTSTAHSCSVCQTNGNHTWLGNSCYTCQYECSHSWSTTEQTHTCTACGTSGNHDYDWGGVSTNYCQQCNYQKPGSSGCVTPETLITLADGTQKRADELSNTDVLLVWNHMTGKMDTAPAIYAIKHEKALVEVTRLTFSNGYEVEIVADHVLFDADLNRYVELNADNAESFIGHTFIGASTTNDELVRMELVNAETVVRETEYYGIISDTHLTCFTNNVLSASAYLDTLLNCFDFDAETMTYVSVDEDIAEFGQYDYAEFADMIPEKDFELLNFANFQISVAKGYITWDEILNILDMFNAAEAAPIQ